MIGSLSGPTAELNHAVAQKRRAAGQRLHHQVCSCCGSITAVNLFLELLKAFILKGAGGPGSARPSR